MAGTYPFSSKRREFGNHVFGQPLTVIVLSQNKPWHYYGAPKYDENNQPKDEEEITVPYPEGMKFETWDDIF